MTKMNIYHTVTNYCNSLNWTSLFVIFIFLATYFHKYWLKRIYINLYRLWNYIKKLPDPFYPYVYRNVEDALLRYKENNEATIENILMLIKITPSFLFKVVLFKIHTLITYILLIYLFYKICFFYEILYIFFILTFHIFFYLSSLLGISVSVKKYYCCYCYYERHNDDYSFSITVFPNMLWGFFNKVIYYIFDILCGVLRIKPGTETSDTFFNWYTFILFFPNLFIDEVLYWVIHDRVLFKKKYFPIKDFMYSMVNGDNVIRYYKFENNYPFDDKNGFKNAFKRLLLLNFLAISLLFIFL